jgi:hypothetical protein
MSLDPASSGGQAAALRQPTSSALTSFLGERWQAFAGFALPMLFVVYLALKGGAYDSIIYSEAGIVAWWLILIACTAGLVRPESISRTGLVALGALFAFAVWTALGIGWSESAEQSAAELGRVASYLGVFGLALALSNGALTRPIVWGVMTGIGVVALLALASRLEPDWFPASATAEFLPNASARLNYPLNYWNGLAALMAIGIPLALWCATTGRSVVARSASAAAIPVMALVAFYTLSRGGIVEIAAGIIVFLVLSPRRLGLLPLLATVAAGSSLLIAAATQRDAVESALVTTAAQDQAGEMWAIVVAICAGVALVTAAISLVADHGLVPGPRVSRARASIATGAIALVAVAAGLGAGLPGEIEAQWQEFKADGGVGADTNRLLNASGNGRYELWTTALDANATSPVNGIGPGTFEYWWAEHRENASFSRDAHSLYFETLAELGVVGLIFILVLIGAPLAVGAWRATQSHRRTAGRRMYAALAAAMAAFAVAAGIDWAWELAVLPIVFLLLAAAAVARGRGTERPGEERRVPALVWRLAPIPVALIALVAIIIPYASTSELRASQADASAEVLPSALSKARTAASIQPYAATPALQEALVLELEGDTASAAQAARRATREEPTNWRTWFILSRLEARTGDAEASVAAYRQARELNPLSPLFAQ